MSVESAARKFKRDMQDLGLGVIVHVPGHDPVVVAAEPPKEENMSTTAESALERTVREEQQDHDDARHDHDPEAEGKLFEVPRVKVTVDDTDPTVLKVAFSGSVEIERGDARWVDFYNKLRPGRTVELELAAHVAGAQTRHRRDSEGDVDAVVQTKSLVVTDLHLDG